MRINHNKGQATGTVTELEHLPDEIGFTDFVPLLRRGIRLIKDSLERLFNNDNELRGYWQPGDVKLSMRQRSDTMPGFLYLGGIDVPRDQYSALLRAIGDGGSTDPTTFRIPQFEGRVVQAARGNEPAGSMADGVLGGATGANATVRLTLWVKT